MASEFITLDPEFEGLLREVAAEPGSTLLRVDRPKRLRCMFARDEPIRETMTGLRAVERHFLAVHRNEFAELLRQAARYKLIEGPRTKRSINRHGYGEREIRPLDPGELARRRDELNLQSDSVSERHASSQMPESDDELRAANDLLLRYFAASLTEDPSAADLAIVSLRLQPTNGARLIASIDLTQGNSPGAGFNLALGALAMSLSSTEAARAWERVGAARLKLGQVEAALVAYRNGCECNDGSLTNAMNWNVFALQLGRDEDVFESSRRLDELMPGGEAALRWFLQCQVETRDAGQWRPSPRGVALAHRIGDSLGQSGRRIADVFV
jgi:hypothetical protein